jgi:hypothetical protein
MLITSGFVPVTSTAAPNDHCAPYSYLDFESLFECTATDPADYHPWGSLGFDPSNDLSTSEQSFGNSSELSPSISAPSGYFPQPFLHWPSNPAHHTTPALYPGSLDILDQPLTHSDFLSPRTDSYNQNPLFVDPPGLNTENSSSGASAAASTFPTYTATLPPHFLELNSSPQLQHPSTPVKISQSVNISEEGDTCSSSASLPSTTATSSPDLDRLESPSTAGSIECNWPSCDKSFPTRTKYL